MVFRSQLRRQFVLNLLLFCIPDIIIAAVGSAYLESGYVGFGLIFVGLQGLGIVYRILHAMVQWTVFLSFGRRSLKRHLYDYLITNQYPPPSGYQLSAEDYFSSVVENKELDPELRIKAAIEVGTFAAYSGAMDIQRLNKISIAAEEAIKDYRMWLADVERSKA
jgi:hypothetical protein